MGAVPSDRTIVIERFSDEVGDQRVCVLTPFGARVHTPWALVVTERLREAGHGAPDVLVTDDGVVFRVAGADAPPAAELFLPRPDEAMHEYGVRLLSWDDLPRADAIVGAVSHRRFNTLGAEDLARKLIKGGCVIDVKSAFDATALTSAGLRVWRL